MERASVVECADCEGRAIEDIKFHIYVCVITYQTTNRLFLKNCSLWIIAPYAIVNVQEIQFSSVGLYCLESDGQNETKHYPGAVQVTLLAAGQKQTNKRTRMS